MAKKHEDIELEIEETQEEPLRDDIEEQEAAVETEEQEEQEETGPEEDAALSAREQRKATIRALQDDTGSERVNISLRTILGGDLLAGKWFRRQIWLIVLIAFYIIVYVSNRYSCQHEQILTKVLSDKGVNIAFMRLFRESKGNTAYTIVESDGHFPEGIEEPLKNNPNVHDVMIIEP